MITPSYAVPAWIHGLDLGQRRDFTAFASVELFWTYKGRDAVTFEHAFEPTLNLCALSRYPLGTSYAAYPEIVANRLRRINAPYGVRVFLVVDAGGPGAPVVDELRRAHLNAVIQPILITGGASPGHAANGYKTVPRRELISNLVLLLDHEILRWPEHLPEREALEHELLNLSAGTTHPDAAGAHDDLVMAVALAAWHAKCFAPRILPHTKDGAARRWSPQGPLF